MQSDALKSISSCDAFLLHTYQCTMIVARSFLIFFWLFISSFLRRSHIYTHAFTQRMIVNVLFVNGWASGDVEKMLNANCRAVISLCCSVVKLTTAPAAVAA